MIRLLIPFLLWANLGHAQGITTDAFGVVPTDQLRQRENWAGLRVFSDGGAVVQPAAAPDAAIVFAGPKSIVAGAEDGHVAVIGMDVYGNMVDGAATRFELGFGATRAATSTEGIAHLRFRPPPQAGVLLAGATIGGVQSARADYRVTAQLATVQPAMVPNGQTILPETFAALATQPLTDAYGNIVDDGVGLNMLMRAPDGTTTLLPAVVRDAAAHSTLLARDVAGPLQGHAVLAGRESDDFALALEALTLADVGVFHIWPAESIDAVRLRLGPLQTNRGYLVTDGTKGQVFVTSANGDKAQASGWVLDGYLQFTLPLSPLSGPFDITLTIPGNVWSERVLIGSAPENATIRGAR